jgi:hypothetical protein
MRRRAQVIVLVAMAAIGCSDSGSPVSSPTAPTQTSAGTPPPGAAPGGCPLPSAPTNLRVAAIAGTQVTLAWTEVSSATQYVVLVGTSPSSSNTLSTNTTQVTYSWSGVPVGRHFARVQTTNLCGTSGSSNEVEFTVAA